LGHHPRIGIALLATASAFLMLASAYSVFASGNPMSITSYSPMSAPYIEPRLGPIEAIAFVVIEHVLIGLGLMFLSRPHRSPVTDEV
jgi:hypothetical protein